MKRTPLPPVSNGAAKPPSIPGAPTDMIMAFGGHVWPLRLRVPFRGLTLLLLVHTLGAVGYQLT